MKVEDCILHCYLTLISSPTSIYAENNKRETKEDLTLYRAMPSSRTRIRQLIKSILIRRLGLPSARSNNTQLEQQRLKTIKKLTMRIETSLYRRSLSMDWYGKSIGMESCADCSRASLLVKNDHEY